MYICYLSFFYFLFFSNYLNFFSFISLFFFGIFFFINLNFFNIFKFNLFIEDRILALLESITQIDYNLVVLCIIVVSVILNYVDVLLLRIIPFFFLFFLENFFQFQNFSYTYFYAFKLNIKLLNGLFLIHPYCIYIFYAFIVFYSILIFLINFKHFRFLKEFKFNILTNFKHLIIKFNFVILFFGVLAISLGSWWAYQEVNWNNWWNWDLIELINFLLIFIFLLDLHNNNYNFSLKLLKHLTIIVIFLNFLILSRYNIINSLHSFILMKNFEQFSYMFFCIYLLITLFYFKGLKLKIFTNIYIKLLSQFSRINLIFYLILILYLFKIYYEVVLFFFRFESNIEYIYFFKNFIYIIMYSFFFKGFCWLIVISCYFIPLIELAYLYSFFNYLLKKKNNFFMLHLFIFIFIYLNYSSYLKINTSFKTWNFNFFDYIDNFKINFFILKQNNFYLNFSLPNFYDNKVGFYYLIEDYYQSLIDSKKIIFFLSNFFLLFSNMIVLNFKFFFIYSLIFLEFIGLFTVLAYLLILIYYLNKKISKKIKTMF